MDRRQALRLSGMLAGTTMSAGALLSLLHSCQTEPRLNWEPRVLPPAAAATLSAVADAMLPRTDTPGALDAGVDVFIDRFVDLVYEEEAKRDFIAQLEAFNATIAEEFGKGFAELGGQEQLQALAAAEQRSTGKFTPSVWGTAVGRQQPIDFYRSLKSTIVWAYLSAEVVGTEVLNYLPVPGTYDGDVPLDEVGNAWAL